MPTRVKNWLQGVIITLLSCACIKIGFAQEGIHGPELTMISGLPSNTVRCIKIDHEKRLWVGTDNGLAILNANNPQLKNIISSIGDKSIWGLELLDSLAFIGTRNHGLYVFNLHKGKLTHHYKSKQIPEIRRIRKLSNSVFILTNSGTFEWSHGELSAVNIRADYPNSFLIDIFEWKNEIYGLVVPDTKILKYSAKQFTIENKKDTFPNYAQLNNLPFASAFSYKDRLILGGITYGRGLFKSKSIVSITGTNQPVSYDYLNFPNQKNVVWDVILTDSKVIMAIGNSATNTDGFIYITDTLFRKFSIPIKDNHPTCLAYDSTHDVLYYGTLGKGLYMRKNISSTVMFPHKESEKLIISSKYAVTSDKRIIRNLTTNSIIVRSANNSDEISNVFLFNDTLLYEYNSELNVYLLEENKIAARFSTSIFSGNARCVDIKKIGHQLFLFANYGPILSIDLTTKKKVLIKFNSHSPIPKAIDGTMYLLNTDKGLGVINKDSGYYFKTADKSILYSNDFTVINDTLYTINSGLLKSYIINKTEIQLTNLTEINIDKAVQGFESKWINTGNNRLYVGNERGVLTIDSKSLTPTKYYYFGNLNSTANLQFIQQDLVIQDGSYVRQLSTQEIDSSDAVINPSSFAINIPDGMNEKVAFNIAIQSPSYQLSNHSLKRLEIYKGEELVMRKYFLDSIISILDGLMFGEYNVKITIGNTQISKRINISLPINRNPYFFTFLGIVLLIISSLLVKYLLNKRKYEKELMRNRLQILNQNLNPHFVFNTMNLISALVLEGKNREAVQVIADFSNLQRIYLETNSKENINLKEELDFLELYLKLQQVRFSKDNAFTYTIQIEEGIDTISIKIPPLILQPIAENAIKYGIQSASNLQRNICIDISFQKCLTIAVDNSGAVESNFYTGLGIGHKLIEERIKLYNLSQRTDFSILFGLPSQYFKDGYRTEIHFNHIKVIG